MFRPEPLLRVRRRGGRTRPNLLSLFALALVAVAVSGCGADAEAPADADEGAAPVEAQAAAPAAAEPAPSPSAPEPEAPPPVTEPPPFTSLQGVGVVEAGALRGAYAHLIGHTVVVAGHPSLYQDEGPWPTSLKLTAEGAADAPHQVECRLDEKPEGTVKRTDTVVVRGTFARRRFGSRGAAEPGAAVLTDCSLVSVGDDFTPASDPWAPGLDPVPAADLHRALFGWQGETVRVRGRFQGSTYVSSSGETRHDLEDAEGHRVIECMESGESEAPQWAVDQGDGVVVEGAVGVNLGDRVTLTGCRFVEGA